MSTGTRRHRRIAKAHFKRTFRYGPTRTDTRFLRLAQQLVIDDVGLLPMPDRSASSVFFQVVNTRYQRGSTSTRTLSSPGARVTGWLR
ncbi:MAG: hypothetical protein F4Z00_11040 [Acidimicrobiaceae bacterium]|nr:hypothetical protein [Acidimicrobiaceae bacterium]MXZ66066.1 hypothetical protein [Acidimicrobiaceae bacterium]MYF33043.1 hypothetical protein [Acidimicrobiaceae bacterium]MYG79698.1 hypothetical protein [Acidimicrobiaceae bacterium]MYJ83670.1 hypothetical protein [Acidimicrobiaceae bacterium]